MWEDLYCDACGDFIGSAFLDTEAVEVLCPECTEARETESGE